MKTIRNVTACVILAAGMAFGQQPTLHDQLLDHLAGNWVMQGTIMGKPAIHDIQAAWVLGHQYVLLHEVAREKNAQGTPAYEAMVYVGWYQPTADYVCAWLDTYGGMGESTIGRSKRDGNGLHFRFVDKDSVFHTRFVYHPDAGNWEWLMDSEEKGALKPFLRAKLTRK